MKFYQRFGVIVISVIILIASYYCGIETANAATHFASGASLNSQATARGIHNSIYQNADKQLGWYLDKQLAEYAKVAPPIPTRVSSLPMYNPTRQKVSVDWLVKPVKVKAGVFRTGNKNEIIISNGLISRTFRLWPNAATVGFDNLITHESILRAVKPEATITIDGVSYEIGGLHGQPDHAFLQRNWIDKLKANPKAFQFTGFAIGKPQPRMVWKRVRHCASGSKWPPPGVLLRMDYKMPVVSLVNLSLAKPQPSAFGRKLLIGDDFQTMDKVWKIHVSPCWSRSSFDNEGKPGEIYTLANTAVYAQRSLPEQTRLVEVTIDAGTDNSSSWGPGIALVWPNRVVKFNLRPSGNATRQSATFGIWDGTHENPAVGGRVKIDLSKPWTLRMLLVDNKVYCQGKPEHGQWKNYTTIALDPKMGPPQAVRIGKMSRTGRGDDFNGEKGKIVRLHILYFAAYSGMDKDMLAQMAKKLSADHNIRVSVYYELYDGVPVLSKWITVQNNNSHTITLNSFTSEILAAVEYESRVGQSNIYYPHPNIHVETDYAFGGGTAKRANRWAIHWQSDPEYKTQVNYVRQTPCMLKVSPTVGPDQDIRPGKIFTSFHSFILPFDSYCRERNGLAIRHMYRTIAPWVTENPLMMHVRYSNWKTVKTAIDQCAEVGFEMVILSFGSGFNIENNSPAYLAKMKQYADYARSKGIEIGGYSLLASRRVGGGNDVVSPKGQRPAFGNAPSLTSKWGQSYFHKLYQFFSKTGFMNLEHDGSYPGDIDITPRPPLQKGQNDSRWVQWKIITDFYKWCRGRGIYLNVPDFYYLSGSNKCGMGYRETNWSLPRELQLIHTRQNIYDGTWEKTPSMGWMFVPLTQYHGGGAAATIEPLHEHLHHYEMMLVSNLGAGVQACYRGPRLYDTEETKNMVKKWVSWYKKHRAVLEGDIIHLRRPDGRDIDYWLNVNPAGTEKGLLMVFNPLNHNVSKTIKIPLYYTGLKNSALVSFADKAFQKYPLQRDYSINLEVTVPAQGFTWVVFK